MFSFKKLFFLFLVMALAVEVCAQSDLQATYLRCEYKINPVTDVTNPRLSWELTSAANNQYQTGYQVLVASSPLLLEEGKTDLWDSKKVISNAAAQSNTKVSHWNRSRYAIGGFEVGTKRAKQAHGAR